MKKILFLIFLLLNSLSFSFNNRIEITKKIIKNYQNSNLNFQQNENQIKISAKRGQAILTFDEENQINSISINHKIKNPKIDKSSVDLLFGTVSDLVGDSKIINFDLSDENKRNYEIIGDIHLSNVGILTKIIDVALISKSYGLLVNNGREQILKLDIKHK